MATFDYNAEAELFPPRLRKSPHRRFGYKRFTRAAAAAGAHTITGFNPVQDLIELPLAQFGSFAAVQEATSAIAGGAEINLGHGSSLLLPGVNPAALHASNFALT